MDFVSLCVAIGALLLGFYNFKTSRKTRGETQMIEAEQRRQEVIVLTVQAEISLKNQLLAMHEIERKIEPEFRDRISALVEAVMERQEQLKTMQQSIRTVKYTEKNISATQLAVLETLLGDAQAIVIQAEESRTQTDDLNVHLQADEVEGTVY